MLIFMSKRADPDSDRQVLDTHPDLATSATFLSTFEVFIHEYAGFDHSTVC